MKGGFVFGLHELKSVLFFVRALRMTRLRLHTDTEVCCQGQVKVTVRVHKRVISRRGDVKPWRVKNVYELFLPPRTVLSRVRIYLARSRILAFQYHVGICFGHVEGWEDALILQD